MAIDSIGSDESLDILPDIEIKELIGEEDK